MEKAPTILDKMKRMRAMTDDASHLVYRIIDDIYKPDSIPNIEGKTVNPSCMDEEMDYMIESMEELTFFLGQLRERLGSEGRT